MKRPGVPTSFRFFCFKMAKRNLVIWLSVLEDMLETLSGLPPSADQTAEGR